MGKGRIDHTELIDHISILEQLYTETKERYGYCQYCESLDVAIKVLRESGHRYTTETKLKPHAKKRLITTPLLSERVLKEAMKDCVKRKRHVEKDE